MLVSFYRHARGQNALKEILGPVVREVLQDRTLSIRIDPVEIYKSWINQTESQTGHKRSVLHLVYDHVLQIVYNIHSCCVLVEFLFYNFVCSCYVCGVCFHSSLPYEVSAEQALSHPEVQQRLNIAITNLKTLTDRVLHAITSNLHKLPYVYIHTPA